MKQFFFDENGHYSMKRLCGLLCVIALCVTITMTNIVSQQIIINMAFE